jgi:HlyD family secretion protein
MSGKVERIFVDFNDEVRRGDILAELNTDMLRLRREQQYASVIKARANHALQELNYRNQLALAERNLISEFELMTTKTQLDGLAADLAVALANLRVIETEINQYAFITSPIDGIVLDRSINEGDLVVDSSSNNAYSIFILAENLREMQIEANVGELDVVFIQRGQPVRFTLESLPGRSFTGEVENLRMIPQVTNNVVSYTVIIRVENQDGSLMPGMTCMVEFIVDRRENALVIPNAALRYQPTTLSSDKIEEMVFNAGLESLNDDQRQAALDARSRTQNNGQSPPQNTNPSLTNIMMGQTGRMMGTSGGGRQSIQGQTRTGALAAVMRNVWYINGEGRLDVKRVRTGITNGSFTEIITEEDLEGKQIILRERI